MFKKARFALALGGGGARGLAHLGVLRALANDNIPIDIITGSGIGALIGALYAEFQDIDEVDRRIRRFFTGDELKKTGLHLFRREKHPENFFGQIAHLRENEFHIRMDANRLSLMKENRLGHVIDQILGDGLIENTRIKFAAVATNLQTGETVTFKDGSLREAVKASSSMAGFLPPIVYRDMILIEGAVSASIPVESARSMGADFVVAVNTGKSIGNDSLPDNMIDILFQSHQITLLQNDRLNCQNADMVIRPRVGEFHWAEFDNIDKIVAAGEKAALEAIPKIRLIGKKPVKRK